jgi:mono/diheme cytochrome c family protein
MLSRSSWLRVSSFGFRFCASCHQATGQGVPGAFPPLVGHVPELYNAQGGHDYLINLLLYGLQGEIQVQGQTYNGVMPGWQQLSDEEIADLLNYTATAWGNNAQLQNFEPYEAADIAPLRDAGLSAQDVYNLRQELGLGGE